MSAPKLHTALTTSLSDLLKHFTTLSAGSIVLSASFIPKLSGSTQNKSLMTAAIVSFMLCILLALVTHFWIAMITDTEVKDVSGGKVFRVLFGLTLFGRLVSFGVGIGCAGFFVTKNL
jgi:hypothetical protein